MSVGLLSAFVPVLSDLGALKHDSTCLGERKDLNTGEELAASDRNLRVTTLLSVASVHGSAVLRCGAMNLHASAVATFFATLFKRC
jgi:hypothetical protein